jgi:hypothetical protein
MYVSRDFSIAKSLYASWLSDSKSVGIGMNRSEMSACEVEQAAQPPLGGEANQ